MLKINLIHSIAFFVILNLQIIFSSTTDTGTTSLKDICSVPSNFSPGNPAAKRIHTVDVSDRSHIFLSKNVPKILPAICLDNNLIYRIEVEEPPEDDKIMNAARVAIGETSPEAVEFAKEKLTFLLKNDSKLKVPLENDAWLVRFLRLKKYNVAATYRFIKYYYNFKAHNRDIFDGSLPSSARKAAESEAVGFLPNRDPAGRRIVVLQARNWDPKENTLIEECKMAIFFAEAGAYEPRTQLAGVQIIIDVGGLNLEQVRQFHPLAAKRIVTWFLRAAPFRYEAIHIVRQPRIFWTLFNIFKPFLTKELRSKIFFHGDKMESLHRHIPASHLPDALGGSYATPSLSSYEWSQVLKYSDEEYSKLDSYGVKRK